HAPSPLSLHDALPIFRLSWACMLSFNCQRCADSPAIEEIEASGHLSLKPVIEASHEAILLLQVSIDLVNCILGQMIKFVDILHRSEEHTSELQSRFDL